jgi:NADH-quinone oxidoreductase subunit L
MPEFLEHHPGFYFVGATLLPMLSFVLILLAFAVKTFLRKSPEGSPSHALFTMMGGAVPSRVPAFIATGAIGLACVLSIVGFVTYASGHAEHEANAILLEGQVEKLRDSYFHVKADKKAKIALEIKDKEKELKVLKDEWQGQVQWAGVGDANNELKPGTALTLGFRIDMLSAVMFVMVTFIATLIHLYSMGYMADELGAEVADHQVHTAEGHLHRRGRFGRFFLYLSLFCFSMLNLVLADNLFQVFVSWELVGICSYLLIGFYFERQSASNAANKAFITNRVGDAGFIVGLLILWTTIGTFNFEDLFRSVRAPLQDSHGEYGALAGQIVRVNPVAGETGTYKVLAADKAPGAETKVLLFPRELGHFHNPEPDEVLTYGPDVTRGTHYTDMPYWMLVVAGLGIFLGCVGKSAQFPLQVWLPDAMEGPTPVSALIHAATMVAAGVYLVGRCYPLFTPEALLVIAYTGAITLFVAATIALVMTDIKKVLAYSTVSQLGYMMLALGVGGWVAGLFHLITHAFFKALLFLGSGSVIYGCHHEQEMTKMGGLYPKMKVTAVTMLMGCLAIAGIPFFSGWYSKDAILAQAMGFVVVNKHHFLLLVLPVLTAGLTTFYMMRMWLMTFTGKPRDHEVHVHAHESPWLMTVPLIILAFFSIVVAWGWPIWDAEASGLQSHLHHAQHTSVMADFGFVKDIDQPFFAEPLPAERSARIQAQNYHHLIGNVTLGIVILAIALALSVYYFNLLDPAEAKEQFPGIHHFLTNKWYFDAVYSVLLVRPALVVAGWCRIFDSKIIDGAVDNTARAGVEVARGSGRFDKGVIDGLVNVFADACWSAGAWLRNVQTGYLRSYVVLLVVAAVGIWVILFSLLGAAPGAK